jgi:hypothetical protein
MTPEEYQELLRKIEEAYQTAIDQAAAIRARAEARRSEQRSALQTVWSLARDGQSPPVTARARPLSANGDAPTSQRQRIRRIIDGLTETIDSAVVRQYYEQVYREDRHPESSTVMKIIREMVGKGWLRLTEEAGFQTPAKFEKTEIYGREE